ncbi:MAG TPA: creatininase family protein, partial [Gemmatimonadales bacterium]
MSHPWRLKEMTPDECRTRLQTFRRLIVPAGTLEFRAPHLPLGTDTLILERLADDLSARTGIPRAPAVEFGVHARADLTSPGVASVSRKTLHRLINELIASWELGAGVNEVMVLTAHAVESHQEALSTIRASGEVRVVDIFGFDFDGLLGDPRGPL